MLRIPGTVKAVEVTTNLEYVVVPKSEWDLLNKDLENMQDIVRAQCKELNAFKSKEYQQFERIQEELILNQFMVWLRDHRVSSECALSNLKTRPDFAGFLNHALAGCERARQEYVKRQLS